jgi:hypothetical protein
MRKASEHQMQCAVIEWCRRMEARYPELKLLYAIPNGIPLITKTAEGKRVKFAIMNYLKKEGMRPGALDLCLPVPRGTYHGLYIEMKTAKGKLKDAQYKFAVMLKHQGYCVLCVRSTEACIQLIEAYLKKGPFQAESAVVRCIESEAVT